MVSLSFLKSLAVSSLLAQAGIAPFLFPSEVTPAVTVTRSWTSGALLSSASGVFPCRNLISWCKAWSPRKPASLKRLWQAAHKLGDSFSFILHAPMKSRCSFPAVVGVPQTAVLGGTSSITLRIKRKVFQYIECITTWHGLTGSTSTNTHHL